MADRNGEDFLRVLASADFLSERAIFLGFLDVKIPFSRSSASLFSVTLEDHLEDFFLFSVMTDRYFSIIQIPLIMFVALSGNYNRG